MIPILGIKWLSNYHSQSRIGATIGVSQTTVSRYLRGVTPIPLFRQSAISLYYERTQFSIARSVGYPARAAANLRGLLPDVFESHIAKSVRVLEKWAEGRLSQKIIRENIDILTVDLDALYDDMLAQVSAETRDSDIDWDDFESGYKEK